VVPPPWMSFINLPVPDASEHPSTLFTFDPPLPPCLQPAECPRIQPFWNTLHSQPDTCQPVKCTPPQTIAESSPFPPTHPTNHRYTIRVWYLGSFGSDESIGTVKVSTTPR
jgi:hypothetical protein